MSSVKRNIIRWGKVLLIFFFTGLFIFVLISANAKIGEVVCTEIDVNISEKNGLKFIDNSDVLAHINNHGESIIINKKIKDIDKAAIEKRIEKNNYVANAEVFSNFEGQLSVKVEQKTPFYRVFNNKGVSYYMDINNERIPISAKFTPRLIVATGYLTDSNMPEDTINKQLIRLIKFINNDAFWKALIGQIDVQKNGDFILFTKIAEHHVILGDASSLEDKFKRLKIFYKEALKKVNWTQYESINLKYKNQIICTKK